MSKGVTRIATTNLMMTQRGPMFLSDTSINIDPPAKDLAKIAIMTANAVKMFGLKHYTSPQLFRASKQFSV